MYGRPIVHNGFHDEGLERPSSWQKKPCEMREEGRCTPTDSAVLFLQEGDIGRQQNKTQHCSIGRLIWPLGSVWAIVNSERTRYYHSPEGTNMKTWGDKIVIWPSRRLSFGAVFKYRRGEVSAILDTMVGSNDKFVSVVRGVSWNKIWRERWWVDGGWGSEGEMLTQRQLRIIPT